MNTEILERHFDRMGARFKQARPASPRFSWRREPEDYALDVKQDRRGEYFELSVPDSLDHSLDANILQVVPKKRHLLLMVRRNATQRLDRFLCGHDEREWFVAAVPGGVSTVDAAKESLKPREVLWAQNKAGLDARQRHRRKNAAFRRQGEWFFLPRENLVVSANRMLRNEPISRTGGKPHMIEYLFRHGGEPVYVCPRHPNGISPAQYERILRRFSGSSAWGWERQRRNPRVYAKGRVRHPDHQTINLHVWHQVFMNTEHQSDTMRNVAFID